MNKKILINKSVWPRLNHASSLPMRRIHVHALVTQRGSTKSVNKDKLLQAATKDDYHYNYHIIIIISVSIIFSSISQELQRKCKSLSFRAQYHYQYQYQYQYRYHYHYSYRCRYRYYYHHQCKYISKDFPGITREEHMQQQSITNYVPPVECIFYSLPGFWIECFSCYGKVVRILQCDFVQASISLNKKQ